jgi:hypothetical protein
VKPHLAHYPQARRIRQMPESAENQRKNKRQATKAW